LLRGPTWPDPGADRGWHRQRMALMPITGSWNAAGVTQAAIAFREPGWWGPQPAKAKNGFLPCPSPSLQFLFRRVRMGFVVASLNAGPARCLWRPGHPWLVRRGAHDPFVEQVVLAPENWRLCSCVSLRDHQTDHPILWTVDRRLGRRQSR
jgi:alpha-mannosidase